MTRREPAGRAQFDWKKFQSILGRLRNHGRFFVEGYGYVYIYIYFHINIIHTQYQYILIINIYIYTHTFFLYICNFEGGSQVQEVPIVDSWTPGKFEAPVSQVEALQRRGGKSQDYW